MKIEKRIDKIEGIKETIEFKKMKNLRLFMLIIKYKD
jgi:hypothetical protein